MNDEYIYTLTESAEIEAVVFIVPHFSVLYFINTYRVQHYPDDDTHG